MGVTTSGFETAEGVETDAGLTTAGDVGVSNTCLVGECKGVSSCSSSTSFKFGTPFEMTGAKAIGAVVTTGPGAAGIVVDIGAAGEVGLGGFFIPKSLKSRSTAW